MRYEIICSGHLWFSSSAENFKKYFDDKIPALGEVFELWGEKYKVVTVTTDKPQTVTLTIQIEA